MSELYVLLKMRKQHGALLLFAFFSLLQCTQDAEPTTCSLHDKALESMVGYYPSKNVMVSPVWDIVRYGSGVEGEFPHRIPWSVARVKSDMNNRREVVRYCPDCNQEFKDGYEHFQKLSEAEKERLYVETLAKNPIP